MIRSMEQLVGLSRTREKEIWEIVLQEDACEKNQEKEDIFRQMEGMYQAMKQTDACYDAKKSASGMVGDDGARLAAYHESGKSLFGAFLCHVTERAIRIGECNACMKRVVAAPTAGSCGVLPAVLLSYQEQSGRSDEDMTRALFVAAGIGEVIAQNACIAGAQGGCQAEIGTASAMAAAALTWLQGGDQEAVIHAAAIAIKGLMGLVCDPVAGLVEVPCVKRNVVGALQAVSSSDLAMAGIRSVIPPDEVVLAMDEVGRNMPEAYRETGKGGLAATATGKKIAEK